MKYVVVICLVAGWLYQTGAHGFLLGEPGLCQAGSVRDPDLVVDECFQGLDRPGSREVDPSGSQEVCPASTTQYTITAAGEGGSGTASTTVSVTALAAKVMIFPEAALFEFGKSELKPEGKEKIEEYREQAKEELSRADQVMITGYTDNVGEPDYNSTLSLQRAEAVRDYLISLGADPKKFQVSGAGEAKPIADNSTEEGRAKNRRVEVAVVGVEK